MLNVERMAIFLQPGRKDKGWYAYVRQLQEAFIDPEADDIRTMSRTQRCIVDSGIRAMNKEDVATRTCLKTDINARSGRNFGMLSKIFMLVPMMMTKDVYAEGHDMNCAGCMIA